MKNTGKELILCQQVHEQHIYIYIKRTTQLIIIVIGKQIQTILDYFDWVQKTSSSVCVPHASMITNLSRKPLRLFFEENANMFKPRV